MRGNLEDAERSLEISMRHRSIPPDFDVTTVLVAGREGDGAGAAEEVLPELRVGEGLLVGAEELEDGAGGDEDHLPLGPAQGNGQPPRIKQKLAGGEQILAVALGGP